MKTLKEQVDFLDWDSELFGLKVGRIKPNVLSEKELSDLVKILQSNKIELIYYASKTILNVQTIDAYEVCLVDRKTTYIKELKEINSISGCTIIEYVEDTPNDTLMNLALESGNYSRFNVDKKIGRANYEALYKLWIINSVNKKLAQKVLVSMDEKTITGCVTLGEKNSRADIGIIAVAPALRGRGIGTCLMLTAEDLFINEGYKLMQVVTQGDNLSACKLYERCGYKIESEEYFYHFWNIHKK